MKLLLDTQILLWTGVADAPVSDRLVSAEAVGLMKDIENDLFFSAVSVWEVAIKYALGKADFRVEPNGFRLSLLDRGYREIAITGEHGARVGTLPLIHKDPFDRLLVAQAMLEGFTLLTVDTVVARYPGPNRLV